MPRLASWASAVMTPIGLGLERGAGLPLDQHDGDVTPGREQGRAQTGVAAADYQNRDTVVRHDDLPRHE